MDVRTVDIDERDPSETIQVSCPNCEKHTFSISIGTLQLMRAIRISCPECRNSVNIYVNPNDILCVE